MDRLYVCSDGGPGFRNGASTRGLEFKTEIYLSEGLLRGLEFKTEIYLSQGLLPRLFK